MLPLRVIRYNFKGKTIRSRCFSQGSIVLQESKPSTPSTTQTDPAAKTESSTSSSASSGYRALGSNLVMPSNFDKKILVWVKKYPSVDKVPDRITSESLQQAKTKARIKTCNWMIVVSVFAFIATAYSGKAAVSRGDSTMKRGMNLQHQMSQDK